MSKKLFMILAAVFMIAGCSDGNSVVEENTNAETTVTVAETDELSATEAFLKTVPDTSYFGGEDFSIEWAQQYEINEVYYTLDEAQGDSINEAIYERNRMTEELLGITITGNMIGSWTECPSVVAKLVQSDDDTYDVFCMCTVQTFSSVLQGYFYELTQFDAFDFEHPWWDTEAILEMYSHGADNVYFASGDINYQDDYALGTILFNKKLCAAQDITPYDDVRNGTWTIDTYHKYLTEFGNDIDGDGKYTSNDMYGVTTGSGVLSYFLASAGEHLIQFDKEGNAYLNNGERIFDVADKVLRVVTDKNSAQYCVVDANPRIGWDVGGTLFPNGHAAFTEDSISKVNALRFSMEDDFGVLPFPKYDEAQESYYSPLSTAAATVYSIPIYNDNPEMSAWILEVMGAYSTDTVRYAAMENVLVGKSLRDDESEDMLNIIFDTKFYDLGFWGSEVYSLICPMVQSYKNNFASLIESAQNKTEAQYEAVKEYYSFK